MNYRKCMVLLTTVLLVSVLLVPVLLVGYVLWNLDFTDTTEEEKQSDELYLKEIAREESADYAAAVKSLLEALDLLEKQSVSDPDKGKLAIACEALCSACLHLKNDKEAEQYGLMALALKKDVYGERHLELFNTECLLGTIYTRLNKRGAALQHYSHARVIIEQNPEVVEASRRIWLYRQLAELYFFTNRQTEFEESLRMLVSLCKANPAHVHNLNKLYLKLAVVMSETYGKDVMCPYLPKMKKQVGEGVAKDKAEAVKWWRKAVEQGHAIAQYTLGWCYANGEGVAKDMSEAVKWYRKAAEQGYAKAQYKLGFAYLNGDGVVKDMTEAMKWWRKAAEQGDATAQYELGLCYVNGDGIAKDMSEAVKWLRKAAEQGDEDAKKALNSLEK